MYIYSCMCTVHVHGRCMYMYICVYMYMYMGHACTCTYMYMYTSIRRVYMCMFTCTGHCVCKCGTETTSAYPVHHKHGYHIIGLHNDNTD